MIADKLFDLKSFQRQYESMLILGAGETIPHLEWLKDKVTLLNSIDWNNMLSIASVLCHSSKNQHLDAALRIAQSCLVQDSTTPNQRNASAVILESLTNKPAIKLAIKRNQLSENYAKSFPIALKLQTYKTQIENSVFLKEDLLALNRFQKYVYDTHLDNEIMSISAPTSAGKSHILCTLLIESLLQGRKNIIYLVPTRALISQVEVDIRLLLKKYSLDDTNISTVPQNDLVNSKSNVFVFTQERLHWFLNDSPTFLIDLLIVDEAQKIEDGNRGILLQQKIEEIATRFPDIKVYFSSPFTSNPEILLDNVNSLKRKKAVNTHFVAVNQNLIYANQISRYRLAWLLSLCVSDKIIPLGIIRIKYPANTVAKKISFIAEAFSGIVGGNVLYANGAAEAEEIAMVLYNLLDSQEISGELKELRKLVRRTIHGKYALVTALEKGIAFHYGNMPLLVRQQIEHSFKEGHIKYLICTSTLLEGVNLPAKAIFIRQPRRGKNHPLNENDFWNLAGRAGRWGKEYSGNIICMEPQDWVIPPNPNKSKQKIVRALDIIENKSEDLIEYIRNGTPREVAESRQDLEFAVGYYYARFLKNKLDLSNDFHQNLLTFFTKLSLTILIPDYIILRNPGISPIAQQSLYDYFKSKHDDIEMLIPVYPEDINALIEYTKFVARIGKTISNYPSKLHTSRAILLTNWMSGQPLPQLINSSYKYYQSKDKYKHIKTLPVVIREVMENVENFVRFRFAKDSNCYLDILRYYLKVNGKENLIEKIPQLNLWLEFGVSQQTHIALLSLGLSRNSVIELSRYIPNSEMNREQSLIWLKEQKLGELELSKAIMEEISKII